MPYLIRIKRGANKFPVYVGHPMTLPGFGACDVETDKRADAKRYSKKVAVIIARRDRGKDTTAVVEFVAS